MAILGNNKELVEVQIEGPAYINELVRDQTDNAVGSVNRKNKCGGISQSSASGYKDPAKCDRLLIYQEMWLNVEMEAQDAG